jgi:hypothetical protein
MCAPASSFLITTNCSPPPEIPIWRLPYWYLGGNATMQQHHQQPNAIAQPMMQHQNQYPNIITNMIINPLPQICSHCSSYILTHRKGAPVLEISESATNPGAMDWLAFVDFMLYHLPNLVRPAPTLCMKQSYQFP